MIMGITGIGILYPEDRPEGYRHMPDVHDYDEDAEVLNALQRVTQDGPGFETEEELPESDFHSYSESDVENDHDGDNDETLDTEVASDQEDTK